MSSTSRRFERLAKRFYTDHIVRLAGARRDTGRRAFPLGPDETEASYFVDPGQPRPDRVAMARDATQSTAQFLATLEALWRERGDEDLTEAIPALHELADAARAVAEESEEGEVSPFIYAMF